MDKKLKKQWVKALRSGEYKQCQLQLRRFDEENGESFCCLGVLADLAVDGDWNECNELVTSEGLVRCAYVPTTLLDHGTQTTLVNMNDGEDSYWNNDRACTVETEGKTFAEIADYIEENL